MANEENDVFINLTTLLVHTAMGCADYFEKNCGRTLDSENWAKLFVNSSSYLCTLSTGTALKCMATKSETE